MFFPFHAALLYIRAPEWLHFPIVRKQPDIEIMSGPDTRAPRLCESLSAFLVETSSEQRETPVCFMIKGVESRHSHPKCMAGLGS